jgi:DNA polymerase-1
MSTSCVIDTMNDRRRDLAGVEAEFGVPPAPDGMNYQALVGDGEQRAGRYESARNRRQVAARIRLARCAGGAGQRVRHRRRTCAESLDWLPKGRELLTIKKDCDLADYIDGLPAMESVAIGAQQTSALRTLS